MGEPQDKDLVFVTISMAEILLAQNLVEETATVVEQLRRSAPDNPRVEILAERLRQVMEAKQKEPVAIAARGVDYIEIESRPNALLLRCELTPRGLAIAKAAARYSGRAVIRLFTAQPGPRGVRTANLDIDMPLVAAEVLRHGLPKPVVHVAAAGYLANTGQFVPLAHSQPLLVLP